MADSSIILLPTRDYDPAFDIGSKVLNTAETVTKGSFWNKVKGTGSFLIGEWAKPVGIEYHALKKAGENTSIFEVYKNYKDLKLTDPKAIKVAGQAEKIAAKTTGETGKKIAQEASKGIFKSLGKCLSKYLVPVMCFIAPTINAFKELQNGGGIVGAVKEFAKGGFGLIGYSAGTLLATAVFGLSTGFVGGAIIFACGIIGSFAFDYLGKAILGKSTEEKLAEAKEQEKNNPQQLAFGSYSNLYEQRKQQLAGNYCGYYNQYNQPVNPSQVLAQAESNFKFAENLYNNRCKGLVA